ncbi:SprT family zinc-dependent metalloprotease [Roseburia hominis]
MKLEYELRRSARRTMSVEVREDGSVLVRAPRRCPKRQIDRFLLEKQDWIREKVKSQRERQQRAEKVRPLSEAEAGLYKEKAREIIRLRTAYYASLMGVSFERISIRDQKTRWGSCSDKGNLNFNWRLILAPPGVLDYVVVHELSHRKEMNHSPRFWEIVEEVMPDYRKYRSWLRENGGVLHRY